MTVCRTLIRLLPAFFLVNTMFAGPSKAYPLQIEVLSAEFHALDSGTPVPKDCDLQNFSAYCNERQRHRLQLGRRCLAEFRPGLPRRYGCSSFGPISKLEAGDCRGGPWFEAWRMAVT